MNIYSANMNRNAMGHTANKLKEIARNRGLSNKDLANLVGTTKETVSRHMNGRIDISYDFAERYSEILNCTPEMIIFKPKGIEVMGRITSTYNVTTFTEFEDDVKTAIAPFNFPPNSAAILGGNDKDQDFWTDHSLYIFNRAAMKERTVDSGTTGRLSIMRVGNLIKIGTLNRQAVKNSERKSLYEVTNVRTKKRLKNQDVVWATPILAIFTELELLGIEIIS